MRISRCTWQPVQPVPVGIERQINLSLVVCGKRTAASDEEVGTRITGDSILSTNAAAREAVGNSRNAGGEQATAEAAPSARKGAGLGRRRHVAKSARVAARHVDALARTSRLRANVEKAGCEGTLSRVWEVWVRLRTPA